MRLPASSLSPLRQVFVAHIRLGLVRLGPDDEAGCFRWNRASRPGADLKELFATYRPLVSSRCCVEVIIHVFPNGSKASKREHPEPGKGCTIL